ncbi:Origin recognition complex subunit 6 [Diplodia seriata]|uniref:Origin recognition complex subunit 6 n=1 Tax=Diplodia seriata TaxID=420778 RepID=A0A1S8BKY5_9PEZI|nr:Origin recognition complex subunit 6 [Diplodia seriata]
MSKPIEQALVGLVPAHNGPLPPELLNTAVSLLAQSRNKASSLRPEEEIARTYVCAHLACERLKQRLNLPPIAPRPPIPPRSYKKVYAYFDSALTTTTTPSSSFSGAPGPQPQTPSRRATRAAATTTTTTPTSKRTAAPTTATTPSRTPTAKTAATTTPRGGARTPTATTASGKRKRGTATTTTPSAARNGDNDDDGIVPSYVTPLIRALCRALGAPGAAVPHVYAGVRSILREGAAGGSDNNNNNNNNNTTPSRSSARNKRRSSGGATAATTTTMKKVEERDVPPLIAVLLMYTMVRLGGRPTNAAEQRERRAKAVEVVWGECEACEGWWGSEEALVGRVENLLVEAKERGWLDMEWFGNVVQGDADVEMGDEDGEEEGDTEGDTEEDEGGAEVPPTPYTPLKKRKTKTVDAQAGVSQGGLGTMMQDKVDYLSEARRAGFVRWKAGIMKRVEQIEREDGQAMDVSA